MNQHGVKIHNYMIPKNSDHQSQNNQFLYKDLQLSDICNFSSVCC